MSEKTMRACQECGKLFYGTGDYFYCPGCARTKKLDTVVRIRTCQDCGVEFFGGPRARRCPGCAHEAQKEVNRRFKRNGGAIRPLGSIDRCTICGKEYTVVSGRQKYCSDDCRRKGVLEWQRKHKKGYNKASGQDVKKQERRKRAQKVCVYCLQQFKSNTSTNLCSDYCRVEQKKISQCKSDIKRGRKRNLEVLEKKREEYRVQKAREVQQSEG